MRLHHAAAVVLLGFGLACDADNPVAPMSTPPPPPGIAISITAMPPAIGTGETSTITVSALRADGNPGAGTAVVSTDFGTFDGSQSQTVTFDANGRATLTLRAPDSAGVATIRAQQDSATAVVSVTVSSLVGQVAVMPDVELDHSRATSDCEDPISPEISVTNLGPTPITYRVVGTIPRWLRIVPPAGPVPSSFQAVFTCDVGAGNLDLTHTVRVQGIDAATGENEGTEDTVTVTVRVRP